MKGWTERRSDRSRLMTVEQLRHVYNARPFRPFIIHLADGRQVPARHREFLAAAPSGRTITVYQPDDTPSLLDIAQVTDLEVKSSTDA
jgi:hypothetical protein